MAGFQNAMGTRKGVNRGMMRADGTPLGTRLAVVERAPLSTPLNGAPAGTKKAK